MWEQKSWWLALAPRTVSGTQWIAHYVSFERTDDYDFLSHFSPFFKKKNPRMLFPIEKQVASSKVNILTLALNQSVCLPASV